MKRPRLTRRTLALACSALVLIILVAAALIFIGPFRHKVPLLSPTHKLAADLGNNDDGGNLDELDDFAVSSHGYSSIIKGDLRLTDNTGKTVWTVAAGSDSSFSFVDADNSGVVALKKNVSLATTSPARTMYGIAIPPQTTLTAAPAVFKYGYNGKQQWSYNLPTGYIVNGLTYWGAYSDDDTIFLTGTFQNTITVNGVNYTSLGQNDVLLMQFEVRNGQPMIVGVKQIGSTGDDSVSGGLHAEPNLVNISLGSGDAHIIDHRGTLPFAQNPGHYLCGCDNDTGGDGNTTPYAFIRSVPNLLNYTENTAQINPLVLLISGSSEGSVLQQGGGDNNNSPIVNITGEALDELSGTSQSSTSLDPINKNPPTNNSTIVLGASEKKVFVAIDGQVYIFTSDWKPISNFSLGDFQPFKMYTYSNAVYLAGYQYPNLSPGQKLTSLDMRILRLY